MSENRFAKCETVEAVLDEYAFYAAGHTLVKSMLPPATDSFKQLRSEQSEALARIRELTPPPTVTPEQREQAREVLALWAKSAIGLDLIPDFEGDPPVIDRIIQALNYVPALASLSRCSCGFTPPTHTHAEDCPVFGAAARGYTPPRGISVESSDVEHGIRLVAEAEPATLTDAPVVQVDASMALWLIQKAGELVGVDDQLTFRRGGHQLTLFRNEVGLVLRIGGGQ